MECPNNVAALFETANLFAYKGLHTTECLRWFCSQNEYFSSQLLHSAFFGIFLT